MIKLVKYICIKQIIDSVPSYGSDRWGQINSDIVYNVGDIIEIDEKTLWIDAKSSKDFLKCFKHLKSLEMKDYFIPYEPIRIALERDRQIDEILNGD